MSDEPDAATIRLWELQGEIITALEAGFDRIEARLGEHDKRFDSIDGRLTAIEGQLAAILAAVKGGGR